MTDITTSWDDVNSRGDWKMAGPDLMTGNDLQTAIIISLFTDRQAHPDDVIPDGTDDPRGWWGDEGETVPIGSRLWLLDRAKQENSTLLRANEYAAEALQWMIDDGVVAHFDIAASFPFRGALGVAIKAYDKYNQVIFANKYAWAWKGIGQ